MMAEWHLYALRPNKEKGSQKYWSGDGKSGGQAGVEEAISYATSFSNKIDMLTYLGAWMPHDNTKGNITETEAIKCARFYVEELRKKNIPWSLNVVDNYYDTKESKWRTETQVIKGRPLKMAKI